MPEEKDRMPNDPSVKFTAVTEEEYKAYTKKLPSVEQAKEINIKVEEFIKSLGVTDYQFTMSCKITDEQQGIMTTGHFAGDGCVTLVREMISDLAKNTSASAALKAVIPEDILLQAKYEKIRSFTAKLESEGMISAVREALKNAGGIEVVTHPSFNTQTTPDKEKLPN